MNSTNNILQINNLSKSYYSIKEETKVLDNISFTLNKNEFLGIIGPSGCGKSSILNIISSLDKEYQGNIITNENIKVGYMLQDDALFPWLTIYDNCILGLKILKKLDTNSKKYVLNLLKKYNLIDFKDKYPNELSGGMRQRVALIRTLAIKPDILLLDEPFSALDYQTRLNVSNDVYNIIKEENISSIIVTHDISEAISMCDRILVLSKRPSTIKSEYNISLSNKKSPIENRNDILFSKYYEQIWRDIDK
ncbi:MAG: ABC transporter ATP-binding protein [Bacilli bacterium]|nr:ABC transporter ATP-binding protein [Bacilli bacterium]